ncbi:MAG: fasciclin domain-containing protein [Sphingopyxis sp.]
MNIIWPGHRPAGKPAAAGKPAPSATRRGTGTPTRHAGRALAVAALCMALGACSAGAGDGASGAANAPIANAEAPTISAALARLSEFSLLRRALADNGLAAGLAAPGNQTLLATRDTAFARLPAEQRATLFAPPGRAAMAQTLKGLIIPRTLHAQELRTLITDGGGSATVRSMAGTTLRFSLSGGNIVLTTPNGATATMGTQDMTTGNGAVYVLDQWVG